MPKTSTNKGTTTRSSNRGRPMVPKIGVTKHRSRYERGGSKKSV